MAVSISVHRADRLPVDRALIEAAAHAALSTKDVESGDLSITFLDDAGIRDLNREYLDHDWSTDVLSFGLESGPREPANSVSGDVYIGADRARAQAQEREIPPSEEAVRLAVHGVLHVLGHDHPDEGRDDSDFFRLQERLVRQVVAEHTETSLEVEG